MHPLPGGGRLSLYRAVIEDIERVEVDALRGEMAKRLNSEEAVGSGELPLCPQILGVTPILHRRLLRPVHSDMASPLDSRASHRGLVFKKGLCYTWSLSCMFPAETCGRCEVRSLAFHH